MTNPQLKRLSRINPLIYQSLQGRSLRVDLFLLRDALCHVVLATRSAGEKALLEYCRSPFAARFRSLIPFSKGEKSNVIYTFTVKTQICQCGICGHLLREICRNKGCPCCCPISIQEAVETVVLEQPDHMRQSLLRKPTEREIKKLIRASCPCNCHLRKLAPSLRSCPICHHTNSSFNPQQWRNENA